MPRARTKSTTRKAATRTKAASARGRQKVTPGAGEAEAFPCPECGKTFSRAASLGAHRNRAHGIAGRSTSSATKAGTPKVSRATRNASTRPANSTVDRDALLGALFPNGIPPRESVIRELNAWLDQAERLARHA